MSDEEEDQPAEPEPEPEPKEPAWPGLQPKQAAYLTALVYCAGQHGKAAKAARIARQRHYQWLETDERYRQLHERAMARVTEVLEDEAIRRAMEGEKRGIYYQGVQCGTEIVRSDGLMMFLLRGAAPEKYRERQEVTGKVDLSLKFAGTMEELLAMYRRITTEAQKDGEG